MLLSDLIPIQFIRIKFSRFKRSFKLSFLDKLLYYRIVALSLFYNHHTDSAYIIDTLLEPFFWFVDHYVQFLGPIFVLLIIILLTLFVIIAYLIGLPFWWNRNIPVAIIALIIGNYLLINVAFHYYMAYTTSPGYPPRNKILDEVVSICKKCINPKPPRTHHCSVCDKCILKMDHHCPWLNNCIGHYNRRYFFMFCLYTWLGTIFIMIFGAVIAYEHIFLENSNNNNTTTSNESKKYVSPLWLDESSYLRHGAIIFEAFWTIGIFASIGALGAWHANLITKGETCIETHINKRERERYAKMNQIYHNPFDKGAESNWRNFLGLDIPSITWFHIIFPSTHPPSDDGLHSDFIER